MADTDAGGMTARRNSNASKREGGSRYAFPPAWQDDVENLAKEYFAEHGKHVTAAPAWRLLQQRAKDYDLLYIQQVVGEAGDRHSHLVWLEWDGKPRQSIHYRTFKDYIERMNRSLLEATDNLDAPEGRQWSGV